ncbi:MAG: FecR domain-containing protein [Chitinophagales bacterium]|nr:FecR domain-containing protein [Chitinophagales bacterium]
MKEAYLQYDIPTLAQDNDFIQWARHADGLPDKKWEEWLQQHPEQREKINAAKSLVKNLQFKEQGVSDERIEALWQRIDQASERPVAKVRTLNTRWIAVAAAIALLLAFFFVFNNDSGTANMMTEAAETKSIKLPDGSTVILNAVSSLSYSADNWEQSRTIHLEGEAFFEVKKGAPFKVITKNGNVEVLGTSFNVDSYDDSFAVNCYTGKVRVSSQGQSTTIEKGGFALLENNQLRNTSFDTEKTKDWRVGFFKYEGSPLSEVFDELERQFDVQIAAPDSILERRYTGFFTNNQLDSALYLVSWPMRLQVEQKEQKIQIKPIE